MIILDTNVLSETIRPSPSDQVLRWLEKYPAPQLFTTAITEAEILYGVALLPKGRRRTALQSAVELMFAEDFRDRVLPFDSEAALAYRSIAADRRLAGRPISQSDAQIAAIARSRGAVLATRNTPDFTDCGIRVINPWER